MGTIGNHLVSTHFNEQHHLILSESQIIDENKLELRKKITINYGRAQKKKKNGEKLIGIYK